LRTGHIDAPPWCKATNARRHKRRRCVRETPIRGRFGPESTLVARGPDVSTPKV